MELISIVEAHTRPEVKVCHDKSYTSTAALLLVMHGKITYFIDGQLVPLHQGELLYMSANTLRSAESDCINAFHRITLLFNETTETQDLSVLFQHRNKSIKSQRYEYMKQHLSQANQIWIDKSPYYEMICQGIISEVLGMLQQELLVGASQSVTRNIVAQVKQYMLYRYRENVHISDLAKHVSRTPNYVSAIFKSETGKTPKEYLNHLRVGVATDLMLSTQMTIGEIADYLGFCDQAYFSFIYKKITGSPPSSMLQKSLSTKQAAPSSIPAK